MSSQSTQTSRPASRMNAYSSRTKTVSLRAYELSSRGLSQSDRTAPSDLHPDRPAHPLRAAPPRPRAAAQRRRWRRRRPDRQHVRASLARTREVDPPRIVERERGWLVLRRPVVGAEIDAEAVARHLCHSQRRRSERRVRHSTCWRPATTLKFRAVANTSNDRHGVGCRDIVEPLPLLLRETKARGADVCGSGVVMGSAREAAERRGDETGADHQLASGSVEATTARSGDSPRASRQPGHASSTCARQSGAGRRAGKRRPDAKRRKSENHMFQQRLSPFESPQIKQASPRPPRLAANHL